jgi:hypothetical protein
MKSITIHNIDDSLDTLIRRKSKETGKSLNKTIKSLLRQSLGLSPNNKKNNKDDFLEFFGVWSKSDEKDFIRKTDDLNKIDEEDWK